MKGNKLIILLILSLFLISMLGCSKSDDLAMDNVFQAGMEVEEGDRTFKLEVNPENLAEELVVKDFLYSIRGEFKELGDLINPTESHKISLKNEEESYLKGIYIKDYIIHDIKTLTKDEYSKDYRENGESNPLYYYDLDKLVDEYKLRDFKVIRVNFTQVHSDKSLQLGPQYGDGIHTRNFLVGRSAKDRTYKIYDYGSM